MNLSTQRVLDMLIGYREFACLDVTDEVVQQLQLDQSHMMQGSEALFHIEPHGNLVHIYRIKDWNLANERHFKQKAASDAARQRNLLTKEVTAKVIKAITGMTGQPDAAEQMAVAFRCNRANSEAMVRRFGDLSEEEVEAFYDKEI